MKSQVGMSSSQAHMLVYTISSSHPRMNAEVKIIGNGERVVTLSRVTHAKHKIMKKVYYILWCPEDWETFLHTAGGIA